MAPSPIVAIGASHASVQLVASLRQGGYTDDMIIVGAEPHLPYNRPPLSKTLLTQQLSFDKTLLRQQNFYDNHNIQLKLGARVKSISRECNQVILDNGETISYSKLVIATGADPIALNLPGEQLKGIGYLRNYDDTQTLMPYIEEGKTAVVVGGGYIGLEVAAALRKAGMIVTVLEGMERVLQRVTSPEISTFYTKAHMARGVKIVTNAQAVEFVGQHRVEAVKCSNGKSYPADLVVIGVGVRPNTALANDAGLRVTDGIYIDEFGRTDDPDIFAIGDCTNFPCHFTNTRMRLESVPNAVEQAKSAAAYICGEELPYRALPWFWSDQYDIKLQIAGINTGFDDIVILGNPEDEQFSAWYFAGDRLLAVDAINSTKDFIKAKQLLSQGQSISKQALIQDNQNVIGNQQ